MGSPTLVGKAILIVEDEYVIAADLKQGLTQIGAAVVGPAPTLETAMRLIGSGTRIDAAILDLNLQGERVFPAADLLREQAVPFLFATGYSQSEIPERFESIVRCEKPLLFDVLCRALSGILT